MSQYEVQIPDSVINIIDDEDSQRKPSSSANESYITAMPHVTSSAPESSFGYDGPSTESMWPLFPVGASSNYMYEVQRMELFRAMNQQRQLAGFPIPHIQYPDYMTRMPLELPVPSQFDELTRSCTVNSATAEPYRPYSQRDCSLTAHDATQKPAVSDAEEQAVMGRKPNCARCRNHDLKVAVKGHKRHCPFKECECEKCILIKERQVLMKKQLFIKRQHDQRGLDPSYPQASVSSADNSLTQTATTSYESHLPLIKRRKVIEANAKASLGES